MVNFVLKPYQLAGESKKLTAQVVYSKSYTFDDIAKHLLEHNIGLSSSAIYGLWEGIKGTVKEYISEGGSINTELFGVRTVIKGTFENIQDGFDGSRHSIHLKMRPGKLIKNIPGDLKVNKLREGSKFFIDSVTDVKTGTVDSRITPGKIIRIAGSRLKICGNDPSCGLYFVSTKSSVAEVKVDSSEFVDNNPSKVVAVIPNLAKGNWKIRMVTQFSRGKSFLKAPRTITYDTILTVA